MKRLAIPFYELLFKLTIFLIPTQLAFHIWPSWSHIFGIRIDYLAPAFYLTDILVLGLAALRFYLNPFNLSKSKLSWLALGGLAVFVAGNMILATSFLPALFKWMKIGELVLFGWLVKSEKHLKIKSWIITPLILSTILFSLIGITQFILGHTLSGPFYFLGERTFSVATPGISKFVFFGGEHLRAYSTFSHPNSFAGFLGISILLISVFGSSPAAFALGGLALLLTLSLGAYFSLAVAVSFLLLSRLSTAVFKKVVPWLFFSLVVLSIASPLIYSLFREMEIVSYENLYNRILLTEAAGILIAKSPIFGAGLNNFIINLPAISSPFGPIWFLQPVHNIFLLVFSETGAIGLFIFLYLTFRAINNSLTNGVWKLAIPMLFILVTGFADHYWLTLQQNELLLSLVFGLSLRNDG